MAIILPLNKLLPFYFEHKSRKIKVKSKLNQLVNRQITDIQCLKHDRIGMEKPCTLQLIPKYFSDNRISLSLLILTGTIY